MAGPWEDFAATAGPSGPWQDFAPAAYPPDQKRAKDIGDAIVAGLQNSATGLALRGKMPSQQVDANAPWYHRIAAGGAGIAADLPLSVAGALAGAPAGAAAGSAVPVIGTAAGTVVGAGAGAFAAPMALREALIQAYSRNEAMSWAGAWEIAKAGLKGGTKGAVIGGATMGAGRAVAPLLAPAGKTAVGVGTFGTELAALTATSAAVEGHMPTWQDFMDNAILLGGMKTAVHVAGGLRSVYAQTGKTPAEVVGDAARDPSIKADLEAGKTPVAYEPLALEQRINASLEADPRPEALRQFIGAKEPPKLGEPPIADPLKYEYITDRDTLHGVLRATENMYAREIETQTRGVIPNKETAAEALRLVASGDIVEHVVGTAENNAQIYARGHMLKGITQNAYNKITALRDIPDADLTPRMKLEAYAAIEQLSMAVSEFRGVRAEAGRALQTFQALKRDASVMPEAETIIKLFERKGSMQDLAAAVANLKDPAQVQRFSAEYVKATTIEKVLEGWKAAILSGPQTHLANILGNTTKWIVEVPENIVSASLTAAQRAVKGDPLSVAQFKARAFSSIYGVQMGAKDAITVAGEVWRQEGAHLEKADVYRTAIEGKKGEVIRLPFKALQVEDAVFRTMAERGEAYKMAVDRATAEGFHPETMEGRQKVAAYTDNPALGLSEKAGIEAINKVQQAGAEGVFAQRLGPRMEIAQRALAGSAMGFVVPFVRTPTNLVSWAVQHTPVLNLVSGRWRADWAAGGERRNAAVARVVVGTGLAMTAIAMVNDGVLTGGGMFEKETGATKRGAGWQPYSVKIGDKYYSYQRIEPVAKVFGIAADLVEMMQSKKFEEGDFLKAAGMLTLIFGNATISTTYMSGIANGMNAMTDPERYGQQFMEGYATSLVPKIVGQTTAMADPHKREVDGILDAVQSQIPFLREKLQPKRDVWGEPVANSRWFAVMPVATSQVSEEKVKTEAVRLQVAIADAPKYVMESGPFNPKDKRVELSSEQRDIFREVAGKQAMTILGPIVNAPDWGQIPDFAKAAIYKHVIENTRKQGQYAALPPDAAQRQQLREKIIDRIIKETQAVQQ